MFEKSDVFLQSCITYTIKKEDDNMSLREDRLHRYIAGLIFTIILLIILVMTLFFVIIKYILV